MEDDIKTVLGSSYDYITTEDTIDLSGITDMFSVTGGYGSMSQGSNTISTVTTGGFSGSGSIGTITIGAIGGGSGAGQVMSSNGAGGYSWQTQPANIQVGHEFSIVNPVDGNAPYIQYKDKKLPVDQLFSMVGAFKTMLSAVAKDEEFCKKHPEIRDLAYAYMLEELGK